MQTDAPALDLATWSCSPVLQAGERLGALYVAGTVAATARDVRRNAELPQMFAALDQSPAFMAVLRGPDYIIESVSQRFHELVGERPLLGRPCSTPCRRSSTMAIWNCSIRYDAAANLSSANR
ncbi:hypothetical protein ACFOHQ_11320 [Xanthomonas fragariae]